MNKPFSKSILWVYGGVGYGKTTLISSIVQRSGEMAIIISAEQFLNYIIADLRTGRQLCASRFRHYQLLAIDNLDVGIIGKTATQKELRNVIYEIVRSSKTKVILVTNKRPRKLPKLKFHTDDCQYFHIKKPDTESKLNLLKVLARERNTIIPDYLAIHIAESSSNLFQLKGMFNQLQLNK